MKKSKPQAQTQVNKQVHPLRREGWNLLDPQDWHRQRDGASMHAEKHSTSWRTSVTPTRERTTTIATWHMAMTTATRFREENTWKKGNDK